MKKRQFGADESGPTFGPGPALGTAWLLEKRNGERRTGYGDSAFKAAHSVGWSLGELRDVRPMTAGEKEK